MEGLVYHPQHYNKQGRKECWQEMEEVFGADAVIIFDALSAYKYLYRAGEKPGNPKAQDLAKINTYMQHAFEVKDKNGCGTEALDAYMAMAKQLKEMEV